MPRRSVFDRNENGATGRRLGESGGPVTKPSARVRGGRRRRWSATITLCQRWVSHRHWSVSPMHDWMCLVAAGEPKVDEWWRTWQDALSFRRKRPRSALAPGREEFSSRESQRCPLAVCGDSRLRDSGHFSQTTPSPSPSQALGTVDLGNPLPPPLLPCMRR